MPQYDYACDHCGRTKQLVRSIKDHTKTVPCVCGREMTQELGFAHVIADIEPYQSMATGERIRGRAHHRQHLKQHGLIERGTDPVRDRKRVEMPSAAEDIRRAIAEVRSR